MKKPDCGLFCPICNSPVKDRGEIEVKIRDESTPRVTHVYECTNSECVTDVNDSNPQRTQFICLEDNNFHLVTPLVRQNA